MWAIWQQLTDTHLAQVFYEDLGQLKTLGLDGIVSCQSFRAFYPSGLAMATLAEALWNPNRPLEAIRQAHIEAAFGSDATFADDYLRKTEAFLGTGDPHRHALPFSDATAEALAACTAFLDASLITLEVRGKAPPPIRCVASRWRCWRTIRACWRRSWRPTRRDWPKTATRPTTRSMPRPICCAERSAASARTSTPCWHCGYRWTHIEKTHRGCSEAIAPVGLPTEPVYQSTRNVDRGMITRSPVRGGIELLAVAGQDQMKMICAPSVISMKSLAVTMSITPSTKSSFFSPIMSTDILQA